MTADLLRVLTFATLASSAAMLLALGLRKPLRHRFGAHAAYALWTLVPLSSAVTLLPTPTTALSIRLVPAGTDIVVTAMSMTALPVVGDLDPSSWLIGIWLLGSLAMFLVFVRQQRVFVRGLGRLSLYGDKTLRAQTTAGCPALLGAWQPRVVLPADFEQRYSAAERELILLHERTHRKRGDAQINAVAAALRCLFWFNPLIHFAALRFRFDQELACDAAVITCYPQARRAYADALLKAQLADLSLPVGCNWQSCHPLKERIALIKRALPGRTRAMVGAASVAALVVCGSYTTWAAQPGLSGGRESRSMAEVLAQPFDGANLAGANYITYPAALNEAKPGDAGDVNARIGADENVSGASTAPAAIRHPGNAAGDSPTTIRPASAARDVTGNPSSAPSLIGSSVSVAARFVPPRVMQRWKPPYPQKAFDAHQEGESEVLVTIGADGSLKDAHISRSSGSASLDQASIEAVLHYIFAAGRKGGNPTEAEAAIAFEWQIIPPVEFVVRSGMAARPAFDTAHGGRSDNRSW